MFFYTPKKSKSKNRETFAETMHSWVHKLLDCLVCLYLILLIVALPLYSENGYSYIASEKSRFFQNISISMAKMVVPALFLYLALSIVAAYQKKKTFPSKRMFKTFLQVIREKRNPVDFFAGLYAAALVLSFFCSKYREESLWGVDGWQMGLYPQLMFVGIYFLVSKRWKTRKYFFTILFVVSAGVYLLGYLNRFSIYPVKMAMSSPGFISTIGNINWYCGYVVTVLFVGAAFLWQGDEEIWWRKVLLGLYVWLGFATLATQGSVSGIVALAVMLLLLFGMSAREEGRMQGFWKIMLLFSGACLFTQILRLAAPERLNYQDGFMDFLTTGAIPGFLTIVSGFCLWRTRLAAGRGAYRKKTVQMLVYAILALCCCMAAALVILITVNTLHPGSIGKLSEYEIFTFSGTWGSNRGATWKAGVGCFLEQDFLHKLTGVGPDAMWRYISKDGSEELRQMVQEVFGANLALTNAHNEWLTVLVNTGILGLIGFGGMMVSAIRAFLKEMGKNPIACACGFSLLAYTINNMFSFQQVVNGATVYAIMGMGMAMRRRE